MKPACVPCQRFFRPEKNGYVFMEGMPENGAEPGTAEPDNWHPYKLWRGDLWKCHGCGALIIVGVAAWPMSEHYHSDFKEIVDAFPPEVQINDCQEK